MSRIPIDEIDMLRFRMDLPGEKPLSQYEVLNALDGARSLLSVALSEIPEDDNCNSIVLQMVTDLRVISDRMYAYFFEPEVDE